MAVPIPTLTGGASGPAMSGATGAAYGNSSAGGAWTVNIGGNQSAGSATPINWVLIGGAALVGLYLYKRFAK